MNCYEHLIAYKNSSKKNIAIYLLHNEKLTRLEWGSSPVLARTLIEIHSETVTLKKVVNNAGKIEDSFLMMGKKLCVNDINNTIYEVAEVDNWSVKDDFDHHNRWNADTFLHDIFNELPVFYQLENRNDVLNTLWCQENESKHDSPIIVTETTVAIHIYSNKHGCKLDICLNQLDVFSKWFSNTLLGLFDTQLLRSSKQRRRSISDIITQLCELDPAEDPEDVIEDCLFLPGFERRDALAVAQDALFEFYQHLIENPLEKLIVSNYKLFFVQLDFIKWWFAVLAIADTFQSVALDVAIAEGLWIPKKMINQKLPELFSACKSHNISLYLNGKIVKTTPLTFEINTEYSDIDWFELHPTILKAGKKISNQEWENILKGSMQKTQKDSIEIIDIESLNLAHKIQRLLSQQSFKNKNTDRSDNVSQYRLKILEWIDLRKSNVIINLPPEEEAIIESLCNFKNIPSVPLPTALKGVLRAYQKEAYYWLAFLYTTGFGACLADDMGLGKTIQAIAFLKGLADGKIKCRVTVHKPHLVVVPATLIANWCDEIDKFYPTATVCKYIGLNRVLDNTATIVLTTYDSLVRDIEKIKKDSFHIVIFDEAQAVKNNQSKRYKAVLNVSGVFKIALTGTPLENHIGEFYSIINLALPGLLGSYVDFKEETKQNGLEMIIQKTKPFVLRRSKTDVLKELPKKIENDIYLELSEKQKIFGIANLKQMVYLK